MASILLLQQCQCNSPSCAPHKFPLGSPKCQTDGSYPCFKNCLESSRAEESLLHSAQQEIWGICCPVPGPPGTLSLPRVPFSASRGQTGRVLLSGHLLWWLPARTRGCWDAGGPGCVCQATFTPAGRATAGVARERRLQVFRIARSLGLWHRGSCHWVDHLFCHRLSLPPTHCQSDFGDRACISGS